MASLADDALDALMDYDFPGNVRELENILERAVALCENYRIRRENLDLPEAAERPLPLPVRETAVPMAGAKERDGGMSLDSYIDEMEKQAIMQALEQTRWNRTAAAKLLGITFRALALQAEKAWGWIDSSGIGRKVLLRVLAAVQA